MIYLGVFVFIIGVILLALKISSDIKIKTGICVVIPILGVSLIISSVFIDSKEEVYVVEEDTEVDLIAELNSAGVNNTEEEEEIDEYFSENYILGYSLVDVNFDNLAILKLIDGTQVEIHYRNEAKMTTSGITTTLSYNDLESNYSSSVLCDTSNTDKEIKKEYKQTYDIKLKNCNYNGIDCYLGDTVGNDGVHTVMFLQDIGAECFLQTKIIDKNNRFSSDELLNIFGLNI